MIGSRFLVKSRMGKSFCKRKLDSVFKDPKTGLWKAIQDKAVTGTNGDRLFPKRDPVTDKTYGVRIDLGEIFPRNEGNKTAYYRNLVLQINKDPENQSLKDAVSKDGTHAKRAVFELPLNDKKDGLHPDLKEIHVHAVVNELSDKGF